jgi:hypothetical protein
LECSNLDAIVNYYRQLCDELQQFIVTSQ